MERPGKSEANKNYIALTGKNKIGNTLCLGQLFSPWFRSEPRFSLNMVFISAE